MSKEISVVVFVSFYIAKHTLILCLRWLRFFLPQGFVIFVVMFFCADIENANLFLAIAVFRPITANCIMAWTLSGTVRLFCNISKLKGRFLHCICSQNPLHRQKVFGLFGHFVQTNRFGFARVFFDVEEKRRIVSLRQFSSIVRSKSRSRAPVRLSLNRDRRGQTMWSARRTELRTARLFILTLYFPCRTLDTLQ